MKKPLAATVIATLAVLAALIGAGAAAPQASAATLYWGADGNIGTASTDGTNVTLSVSTSCLAQYAFFASATTLYGASGNHICTQDLTGGNVNTSVANTQCDTIAGFTANASSIFYSCVDSKWIGRADLDGSNNNPHFAWGPADYPYSLTTDANWLYIGYSYQGFRRVDVESGGPVDPTFSFSGGLDMRGVAVDGEHIYWTGFADKYVHRANLDGTNIESQWLDTKSPGSVWGVDVDGSNVYWTSRNPGTVGKANLDGASASVQPTLITGINATGQNHQISVVGGTAKVPLGAAIDNTGVPTVSGTVAVDETLTASSGTWLATPDQTYYTWEVSADDGTTWDLATGDGFTTDTYRVAIADIGKKLRVKVRAGADNGLLTSVYSASTIVVPAPPTPVNTEAPSFAPNGLMAAATAGAWSSSSDLTFTYQWQSSPTGVGDTWTDAAGPGNDGPGYLVQSADIGYQLRICVTASNGTDTTVCSEAAAAPTPTAALGRVYLKSYSVLGNGVSLQTYTNPGGVWGFSSNGTTNAWGGWNEVYTAPATGGASQRVFRGATAYGVLIDDQYLYFDTGNGSIRRSAIDGSERNDTFITGVAGTPHWMARDAHYLYWSDDHDLHRAPISGGPVDADWLVHLPYVASGIAVDGDYVYAAGNGRKIARADISGSGLEASWVSSDSDFNVGLAVDRNGLYVRTRAGACVGLTYITLDGSASACVVRREDDTHGISIVPAASDAGLRPVSMGAPTISGTPGIGNTLTLSSNGTWTDAPANYTYRWMVSEHDANVWSVAGGDVGTTTSYEVPAGYSGKDLRLRVIAHNGSTWSDAAYSQTMTVPAPPANTVVPAITGTVQVGETLSADTGTWERSPADASGYTYQWQVSVDGLNGWAAAAGTGSATSSYVPTTEDFAKYLRVLVTATNDGGSTDEYSVATSEVLPSAPVSSGAPTVSGTVRVGATLSAGTGSWTSEQVPTSYTYQWQVSVNGQDGWTAALGEGGDTAEYDVDLTDDNKYLRVMVTATNAAAAVEAVSSATAQVAIPAPTSSAVPQITGTVEIGRTLTASSGTWDFATDYAYVWQSSADGSTWDAAPGSGAATSSYIVAAADAGRYLRVRVTGSNRNGSLATPSASSTRVPSPASSVVVTPPAETPAPVFSPAPGITVGEKRGEAVLTAAAPAAGADLLRGANIWVRPSSKVEYVASALPAGLKLVNGKLVATKPGTYQVTIKVKSAKGIIRMRTIKIKVG